MQHKGIVKVDDVVASVLKGDGSSLAILLFLNVHLETATYKHPFVYCIIPCTMSMVLYPSYATLEYICTSICIYSVPFMHVYNNIVLILT